MKTIYRFGIFAALSGLMVVPLACTKGYDLSPAAPVATSNPESSPTSGSVLTITPTTISPQPATPTPISTPLGTPTPTPNNPPPSTATSIPVNSPLPTNTSTSLPANTASFTFTVTNTPAIPLNTSTPALTATNTSTSLPVNTPSYTYTVTDISTATFTATSTNTTQVVSTSTPDGTESKTDTPTHTPTDTRTSTDTPTVTHTPTNTFTPTPIPPGTIMTGTTTNISSILANAQAPVMLEFWASWCATCTLYTPVVEQFAKDYAGQVIVVRVDCTSYSTLEGEFCTPIAANTYGVPDTVFILNGVKMDENVGYQTESDLADTLDSL